VYVNDLIEDVKYHFIELSIAIVFCTRRPELL